MISYFTADKKKQTQCRHSGRNPRVRYNVMCWILWFSLFVTIQL